MPDYTISAVAAALRVLEAVAESPGTALSSIARTTGLTKSHAFRILRTLEDAGYVMQDDRQGLHLHHAAYVLGEHARRQWDLARVARPHLDAAAAASRENVHLVVRDGRHSLVVDVRESPLPIRMYAIAGRRGPLHAGGTPKVLLAHAPNEVVNAVIEDGLVAFTPDTIVDAPKLRACLADIRRDGYHVAVGDLDLGAFSVAAPILDGAGRVIAAVSVAGPLMRLDPDTRRMHVALILETARAISAELGFAKPGGKPSGAATAERAG